MKPALRENEAIARLLQPGSLEVLREDGAYLVGRGRGAGDNAPLLVITPVQHYAPADCLQQLAHEYALRDELDREWAAVPVALVRDDAHTVLVLDDPGGTLLSRLTGHPLDVEAKLQVAAAVAAALGKLHDRGIVHKDIKPAHLLIDEDYAHAHLLGFGIASRLPRESRSPEHPSVIAGTLAYIAPEQTGRINRSVDARSDLYALGVTLYELWTGRLPFIAADAMEWIHCHVARQPVPLHELDEAVPRPVSDLVMKLLAKMPEERYQTATGVEADLQQCLHAWRAAGHIEAFPLATHDAPAHLLIPERLYGREQECRLLLECFDRVAASGRSELVLISGYSGIGKSSLVNDLHKAIVFRHGLFTAGKFDQYQRDIPYSTLAQAFQSLLAQILGRSHEEVAVWRSEILRAVGASGRIILELIPEAESIIGPQPALRELPPQEAQNRFHQVFRRFIDVFARHQHPLVLFLDDLQWLDAATLTLLGDLIQHPDVRHLLLVGAYRDNEVSLSHPLMRTLDVIRGNGAAVHEIVLAPLSRDDIGQLTADALHSPVEQVLPLADLVHEKTAGNPFFAIQFLSNLSEELLLVFDRHRMIWRWELERIRAKDFTDNVVDLLTAKLKRLSEPTRHALQEFACLGNHADLDLLALVRGQTEEQVEQDLWEALRSGLLLQVKGGYRFLHDRVQEAAYALLPQDQREESHLRIGRLLAARVPPGEIDDYLFDVVNHLNQGRSLITEQEEKDRLAEFNLRAARRAKSSAAYASACTYASRGMDLLHSDAWQTGYSLAFGLWIERAECEMLTGSLQNSAALLREAHERAATKTDKATACYLTLLLHVMQAEYLQAVEVGLDCLRMFGIDIPAHPTMEQVQAEYDKVWQYLGTHPIESLVDLPLMADVEMQAAMSVLSVLYGPAYFTDIRLLYLYLCHMVNVSLRYGNTDASAAGYAWFGAILGPVFHRYAEGYRLGKVACDLVEKYGFSASRANVYFSMEMAVLWTQPLKSALEYSRAAFQASLEAGDLTIACYSANHAITDLLMRGDPLDEVWGEAERAYDFARRTNFRDAIDIVVGQRQLIQALRGKTRSLTSFTDTGFDETEFETSLTGERMATMVCWYWLHKLQARYLGGDFEGALAAAQKAQSILWSSEAHIQLLRFHFFRALALAATFSGAAAARQEEMKREILEHLEQLREWAENGSAIFLDKYLLVLAEVARIENREMEAMRLYDQAIRAAHEHGFIHYEAVSHEVAAQFYRDRGFDHIAMAYLRNARACYLRWGALGKVAHLDERYPLSIDRQDLLSTTTIGAPVEQIDFMTVIKASQAVSGEIMLDNLVESLLRIAVEHAVAERGLVLLPHNGEYILAAEAIARQDRIEIIPRSAAATPADISSAVLHYVLRTRKSVVLDGASAQHQFAADEYLRSRGPRSLLALPLVKQGSLVGILYLENHLTARTFTPSQLAVLELLASQAAISLENARLYADLQRENSDRKRTEEELQRSEAYLVRTNAALRESQGFLQQILDNSTALIYVKDLEGRFLLMNRTCARLFHLSPGEAVGKSDLDLLPPEAAATYRHNDRQAIASGTTVFAAETIPLEDGPHEYLSVKTALRGDDGKPYAICGVSTDITEYKRLEERLRQSQKMEAIGGLAGGIAHDFNNLLGIILGYSDVLRSALADRPALRDKVEQIVRAGDQAAELTRKLLTFSRRQMLQPTAVDVNHVLADLEKMLRRVVTENIELVFVAGTEPAVIRCDPGQMEQLLLNLVINARDAMPLGGQITLATEVVWLEAEKGPLLAHPDPGFYVHLTVSDTGCGMDAATQARIFEPFFTTKEPGKGTGLGLSTVYGIVEQAGGRIRVESEPGAGSTFHLYLPKAESGAELVVKPDNVVPAAGSETILVVEDQDGLRDLIIEVLHESGYQVLSASNGRDALDVCQRNPQSIDLVITDVVMPQMGGRELARTLGVLYPETKVLFISGYADSVLQQGEAAFTGNTFLEKPFSPTVLARRVRELLDE